MQPHSKLFDFEKTAGGAEWIDAFARRAKLKLMMDCLRSATRIGESNTCASRIERSLRLMIGTRWRYGRRQSWSVFAAHGFIADWSLERVQRIPTADDIHAYVADYEEAGGRPFSKLARHSLFAHCVYFIACGARCTHSLDPKKTEWEQDTWPYLLRTEDDNLLRHATS